MHKIFQTLILFAAIFEFWSSIAPGGELPDLDQEAKNFTMMKAQIDELISSMIDEEMKTKGHLDDLKKSMYVNFSAINPWRYPEDEQTQISIMVNNAMAMKELNEMRSKVYGLHFEENRKYEPTMFAIFSNNFAVIAIGISTYLSAAVDFCEHEAKNGTIEIISIGSGNGTIENEIIKSYQKKFGKDLRITLVDRDPLFKVDYKTVDELIEERPTVIRNCVLIINWPDRRDQNDNYDIESVYKLQPRAVLTTYEAAYGSSGSLSFEKLLYDESLDVPPSRFGAMNLVSKTVQEKFEVRDYGLTDKYLIEEVARQDLFFSPLVGTFIYRLVKMTRKNLSP